MVIIFYKHNTPNGVHKGVSLNLLRFLDLGVVTTHLRRTLNIKKFLTTTLLTIIIIAQTSVAQRIYNPINGHLYEKFDTSMTWDDAKAYCESLGGYLATVTSQEENDWIMDNLHPYESAYGYYFGAADVEEEGVWKWVTGEAWDYTNWAPGEPNGGIGENVIQWLSSGLWNDIYGSGARGFVCEYEPSGEIFVSPDGSDEDGDGSAENPYRTIQWGIEKSPRGGIVHVLSGTYTENITLVSDLTVLGSGADQTIITAADGNVVSATNVIDVILAGFTIDGQGTASNGILCNGVTTVMNINDNIITGATKGIQCSDTASPTIWSNTIHQNIEDGVYCDGSANADIKNNTIEQNGRDGIWCDGSAHATIENNTISQNSEDGVECGGSTNVTIDDNNVESNNKHGIHSNGTSEIIASHNIIRYNQSTGVSCGSDSTAQISYNCIMSNDGRGIECVHNANAVISNNLIDRNGKAGIECRENGSPIIRRNTISYNNWHGVLLLHSANPIIGGSLVDANYVVDNEGGVKNHTDNTINATYNYWGTTNENEIAAMMRNEGDGSIDFIPFISTLDKIVGDASGDGTVSTYDAALILQFVVGLIDRFPVSMSESPQDSAPRDYELRLPNLAAKPGERIHAPIAISNAAGLNYGGVIVTYNPSVLKAIDVAALGLLSGSYWKANTRVGEVRFAFAIPIPMEQIPPNPPLKNGGGGDLLMIDFEVLPNTTGLESPLTFDTVEFPESQSIRTINGSVTILPETSMLLQNYPNPFNPETWIPFQLAQDAVVILKIYNQKGQLVRTLHLGARSAGMYTSKDKAAYWDGRDTAGEKVASGMYFYTLSAGDFSATRKLILMK